MKSFFAAITLLGAGLLINLTCPAQTNIEFTYDLSGNRETRSPAALRSMTSQPEEHARTTDAIPDNPAPEIKLRQPPGSIAFTPDYSSTPAKGALTSGILEDPISGDIVYSPAINPAGYSINTGLPVDKTPVNLSISGTPSCNIPLDLPKGINGVQPDLSLNYTGSFTAGIVGTGWSIGGLSVISRVNRNIYNDGQANPIDGTLSDRYALDGNRLLATSGEYGLPNSQYRTEVEIFSKIVAYGSAGQGPLYFIVYTQSGLIYEYGNSVDSRVYRDGYSVLFWKVNKISDRYGNYITFKYVTTDDEHPVETIEYTGNTP